VLTDIIAEILTRNRILMK